MSSTAEIIAFIDERVEYVLQRPHMYAETLGGLDTYLGILDEIRRIAKGSAAEAHLVSFNDYLRQHGVSTTGYPCGLTSVTDQHHDSPEQLAAYAEFYRGYLSHRDKLTAS